jgi:hypothetical protein
MPSDAGFWLPVEAENALKAFGNIFLQFVALHRDFGDGVVERLTSEQERTAVSRLQVYLTHMTDDDVRAAVEFTDALPELQASISGLLSMEVLRRTFDLEYDDSQQERPSHE